MKVSIIIPVYNAEIYVHECIQSLINQTMKDCEFIFVDDGSKDNSGKIIQEYQKKDSRIKLITQENQGVSAARNIGLEVAIGEYVGFVDADDFIRNNMLEVLYKEASTNNLDVIISNFEMEINGVKREVRYNFPMGTKLDKKNINKLILPYFIEKEDLNTVWNKLYKRELIISYNIQFLLNMDLGEDREFNIQAFYHSNSVLFLDYSGYFYREVDGSATRNIFEKDYFNISLQIYNQNVPEFYTNLLSEERIRKLKVKKFITSVLSYIHMYLEPSSTSINQRLKYVSSMLGNEVFREALATYKALFPAKGRYEKLMIEFITVKFTWGLVLLTQYARHRNNKLHGGKIK